VSDFGQITLNLFLALYPHLKNKEMCVLCTHMAIFLIFLGYLTYYT
jgi:hypothetical protein